MKNEEAVDEMKQKLARKIKLRADKIKPEQYAQALGVKTGLELAAEIIENYKVMDRK
jgi:hypothetical protein